MTDKLSLVLIGAGNMGGALFSSWVEEGILDPARSAVIDPNPSDHIIGLCEKAKIALNPETDGQGYGLAVLAVKPQLFPAVLPQLGWPNMANTVFLSIAAGTSINEICQLLKPQLAEARVIRTMPNLPAAVGQGMTLLTAGPDILDNDVAVASLLFEAAGEIVWTENEDQLDRLMGVSGCGPGFVFLFIEALEAAARAQGASAEDARILAEQTVIGSASLIAADDRTAEELRKSVSSPGGTTLAGLAIFQHEEALVHLTDRAVTAAYKRALELAGS